MRSAVTGRLQRVGLYVYNFHTELEPILANSDVVLTDSLPEHYRTKAYLSHYQITLKRMELTISSDYFVGYAFKKRLIYVQQAIVLYGCGITSIL
jgi:ornithine carbamoyltransferase